MAATILNAAHADSTFTSITRNFTWISVAELPVGKQRTDLAIHHVSRYGEIMILAYLSRKLVAWPLSSYFLIFSKSRPHHGSITNIFGNKVLILG